MSLHITIERHTNLTQPSQLDQNRSGMSVCKHRQILTVIKTAGVKTLTLFGEMPLAQSLLRCFSCVGRERSDADIPVVQMSMPRRSSPQELFLVGRALATLAAQDILVIGSGATVHNLRQIEPQGFVAPKSATGFDDWLETTFDAQDWLSLFRFHSFGIGRLSHPTPEHLLPLILIAANDRGMNGSDVDIRTMNALAVEKLMDLKVSEAPAGKDNFATANKVRKYLSVIFNSAMRQEWCRSNPVHVVRRKTTVSDGYQTWPRSEVDKFRDYYPMGSRERLAIELVT